MPLPRVPVHRGRHAEPRDGHARERVLLHEGTAKPFRRKDLENPVTREFCAECGTHLLTRAPAFGAVMLKVGTLDDPSVFGGPQLAIYTSEKQAFHHVPPGITSFETFPGRAGSRRARFTRR